MSDTLTSFFILLGGRFLFTRFPLSAHVSHNHHHHQTQLIFFKKLAINVNICKRYNFFSGTVFTQKWDLSERLLLRMGRTVRTGRRRSACVGRQSRVQKMSSAMSKMHRFWFPRSGVPALCGLQTWWPMCGRLSNRVLRHHQQVDNRRTGTRMHAMRYSM